jgi:thymidylate synthase
VKNIPVLHVEGRSLAEAYERALVALHRHGVPMATQYDRPGDPLSLDATMNITVLEPEADPMIHKAFPGGIEDLREYVLELAGAKDHWVKRTPAGNTPTTAGWQPGAPGGSCGRGAPARPGSTGWTRSSRWWPSWWPSRTPARRR